MTAVRLAVAGRRTQRNALAVHGTSPKLPVEETHCWFRVGTAENYRRVSAACNSQTVGVRYVLAAAAQFASLRILAERTGKLELSGSGATVTTTMDFDLRAAMGQGASLPGLGSYRGTADISVAVQEETSLWTLARALQQRADFQLSRRTPLLVHHTIDDLWTVRRWSAGREIGRLPSGVGNGSIHVGDLGGHSHPVQIGPVLLKHVFVLDSCKPNGPLLLVRLVESGEQYHYSAVSAHPGCDRDLGDRLLADLAELVETCHVPAVADIGLGPYARGPFPPACAKPRLAGG